VTVQIPDKYVSKPSTTSREGLVRKLLRHSERASWFLLAWAILLSAWEVGAYIGFVNARILPPPSQTIPFLLSGGAKVGFGTQTTGLWESILITLIRICVGLVFGLSASIAAGILIVEFKSFRRILLPILQSIAPIAPVAWIPFAIALVGIGNPAALFVVFMAIFGSMSCSAAAAFDAVPEDYLKVSRSMHASRTRQWLTVILPAAAPNLMTMVRMSFFGAWMAVLAGEMAGINSGLGYLITMGQQMYNMKLVMIGVIAIGVVGFALDRLLLLVQRRVLWWEETR
jgi:ABC-type nitrate/sulfonate/bicarbonate transport system permease component